ncbi:MAG: DUF4136 domain-containing protein [Pyrinomonadaceae bacterium]
MMRRLSRAFQIAAACGALLLLCSADAAAQDVRFNYLQGTQFSKYRTYKWVTAPGVQYPNQLLDGQIKQSIDAQLSTKGLTRTDTDEPDLYVIYQLAVDQEKQWNAYSTGGDMWGWGGWGGWGGRGMGGMSSTTVTSSTINVGTLNLDLYDVGTKKQIWRGMATKTVKHQKDPQKLQKNLDKAMAKLLKNYPPPVK